MRELSGVFKGIFTLLIGSGVARIFGIACIPVLTRIYTPEDYGTLALYVSFVAILSPILSLRFVQAIPLPRQDGMAFNLFWVSLKIIIINSLLLMLILIIFGDYILERFSLVALKPWLWLIILGSAGAAFYELFSLWATRHRHYKIMAKSQFVQSLIGNLAKIFLGLLAIKPGGLLIGQALSQSAGVSGLLRPICNSYHKQRNKLNLKREIFIIRYYWQFACFRLPSQILMVISVQAPVIMMAALYGQELTGQLGLAIMVLSLPVGLIGQAVAKAFYAEIATVGKNDVVKIKNLTTSVQKRLFLVGIPAVVLMFFTVKPLFVIVFGSEWAIAGQYAAMLAPFILFQFTSSPLMEVINVIGSQLTFFKLHSCRVIGLIFIFLLSKFLKLESENFVPLISSYLSIFYLCASLLVMRTIKTKNKNE
ncbi:oligosaccharide flippase family protein [Vibrio chagasii]|uniref:lipopolysaccharide biosynthesis protein n=1 Tax=Vibrio chagasii TaxID=170679 RepID=UPI0038CF1FB5